MKTPMMRALVVSVALFVACAPAEPTPDSVHDPDEKLDEGIWHVESGERLEVGEFVDGLEEYEYVIVGESHGQIWHHDVQNRIHRELTDRTGESTGVGLEMIEHRFQPAVDDYLAGEIDEEEMLQKVEWDERWGVNEENYASLWRRAKKVGQPVVALNAPRELVSNVGEVGLEGLDDDERAKLPDIDDDNEEYRQQLRDIFAKHDVEDDDQQDEHKEAFDRFFEAQLVWDETMAENAFQFMRDHRDQVDRMVLLTGRGHVERDHGIPSRLVRRGVDRDEIATVVPVSTGGVLAEQMAQHRDLAWLRDEQISDYVWVEPAE